MYCIDFLKVFLFSCSVLSGILFAIVLKNYQVTVLRVGNSHTPINKHSNNGDDFVDKLDNRLQTDQYDEWLRKQGFVNEPIPHEDLSYGQNQPEAQIEAEFLFKQTKVLCMVFTNSRNRSRALANTWTKHCNEAVFYGSFHDSLNDKLVKINILDQNLYSPRTFCRSFVHLLSNHSNFDWLLITTDRTYAIVENLRYYLSGVNSSDYWYIGRPVHHYFLGVYNSFESGIVLSSASVNLLANDVFWNDNTCKNGIETNTGIYSGNFDAFISMHLLNHGIKPANTLDKSKGSTRFHPFMPERHINPELISIFDSYWTSNVLPIKGGFSCCSKRAITFNGFSSVTMYFIEYLLYHLTAFTEQDGTKGLGNRPAYNTYIVPSDFDVQRFYPKVPKDYSENNNIYKLNKPDLD
ncbi:hypothetical protein BLOT_006080 [Blomia tropicalis]|nr:hypothetical protein BLOT_006080 [Blomia tropicalis]